MTSTAGLLIVDVQVGMFDSPLIPPVSRGRELLATIKDLIARARASQVPVVYVQHCGSKGHPLQKGTPACAIHPEVRPKPDELVVQKHFCDCFHKTQLHELLQSRNICRLVVAGIQTDFCVDTACRRAFSLGYEVTLVEDAHSTWDNGVLRAPQIIAHHNLTLSSSFAKLAKADSLFGNPVEAAVGQ